jgi:hypothetical protein
MIKISQLIETGLLILLFLGIILKIYGIETDYLMIIDLFILNIFGYSDLKYSRKISN